MPGQNYAGFAMEAPLTAPLWPSAVPSQITRLLPLSSLEPRQGINKSFVSTSDPQYVGFSDADVTNRSPGASGSMPLRYGGLEPLFACALGLEARRLGGVVFPEVIAPGVFRHIFEIDPVLSAMAPWVVGTTLGTDGILSGDITAGQRKVRRGTLAAFREFGVWELLSCMLSQLSIAWQPDGCTCSFETLAYSLNTAPTVNTPTTLGRAVPNTAPDVRFREIKIRLAPYSAVTPLSSAHEVAVSSASLTLGNPFIQEQSARTGLYVEEPERSGPVLLQGSLLQPRYLSNTLVNAWPSNDLYMLQIRCTGPLIGQTAYPYQLNCYIPGIRFTNSDPSPLGVGRSSLPLQWYATVPSVKPAGYPTTAHNSGLSIEIISGFRLHTLLGV